ncbi:sensor histidine kinase [Clostridium hydrogeniformans]|uniref:sensor histidine kinase n=1 Tax=Clostridium hydrogeniformans TaxID=349933 RepID=UPI0004872A77|nr:sensor histidine kinase [Clostridium hydrogeniformans]
MYLMELIIKVVRIKARDLIILLINTLVIIMFYYLLFEDSEVIYPLMLSAFVILVYFVIEVIKYKSFQEKLEDSKRSPSYTNSNLSSNEEEVLEAISTIHNEYLNRLHTLNQEIRNRENLFSQWIHNMKTSITVIDLACEHSILSKGNDRYIEDIKEENSNLKKNLEECLNILRLDDFSRDYITTSCNLRELVNSVVSSKKRDFIYKGVFPKVDIDDNISVYTDKKWGSYMLSQIISNSIKYSDANKNNKVEILAINHNNDVELLIIDYGIGIAKEDLPRIFDPFFTGNNGRKERNSSGIGLYMVKIIAEKLGHEIKIESEIGIRTVVKIKFKNEGII